MGGCSKRVGETPRMCISLAFFAYNFKPHSKLVHIHYTSSLNGEKFNSTRNSAGASDCSLFPFIFCLFFIIILRRYRSIDKVLACLLACLLACQIDRWMDILRKKRKKLQNGNYMRGWICGSSRTKITKNSKKNPSSYIFLLLLGNILEPPTPKKLEMFISHTHLTSHRLSSFLPFLLFDSTPITEEKEKKVNVRENIQHQRQWFVLLGGCIWGPKTKKIFLIFFGKFENFFSCVDKEKLFTFKD